MKHPAILAAALATGLIASDAAAQQELRFGHIGKPGSLFEATVNEFVRRANESLGEDYVVRAYGANQLGNDQELLQKLKLGQVTFALPSSIMSSVAPEFGVFEMPYIIRDRAHIKAVSQELLDEVFQPAVEAQGYQILSFVENGFRHITNNVRPINVPADLEGIKLRTPRGEWRVKMFQSYGANPTPMAFSDVFTALQTGVIDGQENPYAQIASAKFQEVQEYLSITGHVYSPAYILTSGRSFDRLPEDVQATLRTAALETQDWVYVEAARLEDELLAVIEPQVAINEADKQAFIDASAAIYEEFGSSVEGGSALIERVMGLAPTN
ncbi:MAG: TRAP transporter substrate-binding protein [Pseudomonadota bacterium]